MSMTSKRRPVRPVLVMTLLSCLAWLADARGAVAQSCQVPPEMMALARTLATLPADAGEVPTYLAERLSAQMSGLSESSVLRALRDNGLDSVSSLAVDLMAEAERIGRGGDHNPARIRGMLSAFEQQSTLACIDSGTSIFQSIQQGRNGGIAAGRGFDWSEIEKRAEEDKLFAAGAVVAAMSIFIGVLMLIDISYRWTMALLYNRKACRIPADLSVGPHVIGGLVITLGKGGCRFHPLDMVTFDAALAELRSGAARISIGGTDMAARCSGIYDTVVDFRFDHPLTLKQQRALLEHSAISPYYIRKSRDGGTAITDTLV